MALRDQPYIPLYVQDVLTDEKLIECSAESHGVYFRLICILHKQADYGKICLKQKYKQNKNKYENFALMLVRQLPFSLQTIATSLQELNEEGVLQITEVVIEQKRMVYDGKLSLTRAISGKKGGSNVTKQYGKPGFLYLMSDGYEKTKIGISVNPKNRLYRLRSDLKLPKHFEIQRQVSVLDMGVSEDLAHDHFGERMDGEWIVGAFHNIIKKFDLLEASIKANTQAASESENESEVDNQIDLIKVIADFENSFNVFWDAYDKKRGLDWCRDAWFGSIKLKNGKLLTDADRKAILANVPAYVKSTPKKSKRKDPKTYLNNRAWIDEIIIIEETTPMWPRIWSKAFENTLQPKPLQAWRKFLRDEVGLLPLHDAKNRVVDWVPKEERDVHQAELQKHG